ncbi:MAG: class I SAM-dependent methyltransferase [Phycisphaeraceae bacterium]|nr:MAG: class I SAM-dependent methyltransferase [Phycisphaeraceae bacterium]
MAAPSRQGALTARTADPRALYEAAVQCVEAEIDFVDRRFKSLRGRLASRLREDFCATAATSCEWVKRRPTNTAVAVDIDPEPLAWSRVNHLARLPEDARGRVTLLRRDVRDVGPGGDAMDMILACNFSYWIFHTRDALRGYFESVRRSLVTDGVFFLDFFGGWEASKVQIERRRCRGFTYVWEHESYNPLTGDMTCHIHFEFPDKTKLRKAFTYQWRLWTLAEVRELLTEAGFSRVTVYWEGDDPKGGGNGIFKPTTTGESCPSWIAWISAEK